MSNHSTLEVAERDLIRTRFPFFAFMWAATGGTWLFALVLGSLSALTWTGALAAEAALLTVLVLPVLIVRRTSSPAVARRAAVTGIVLVGWVWSITIGLAGGPVEILAFVLPALVLSAPPFFAWSWRVELLVIAAASVWLPIVGGAPSLPVLALVAGGGAVALALAAHVARAFRARIVQQEVGARAQRALAESHAAYRELAESARDLIWSCDLEGRFTYVNEAIVRLSGLPKQELIGLSVAAFLSDHPANPVAPLSAEPAHMPPLVLAQAHTPSGPRWFEALVSPLHDEAGQRIGFRGITRDVTDRKLAEERLLESEERFRVAFHQAPIGMSLVGTDGSVLQVNAAFGRMLGRPMEEIVGSSVDSWIHPDDLEATRKDRMRLLEGEVEVAESFLRLQHSAGHTVWTRVTRALVRDHEGRPAHMVALVEDVTERKRAEEALAASEHMFRSFAESMAAGVVIVQDEVIRYANTALSTITGRARQQLIGMSLADLVHPDDRELAVARARARLRGNDVPPRVEYRLLCAGGGERWVDLTVVVIEHQGRPALLGTAFDVTERRLAEEALRSSLEELRQSEERLHLLAQRQVVVREQERRRLSFDLHDEVCQELVGIGIFVESVRCRLGPDAVEAGEQLGLVGRHANKLAEHLRQVARELRPMLLHDLGLADSLRSLAAGMSSPTTKVTTAFPTSIPRLDEDAEVAVYRVVQEAIANALRHAKASEVGVSLSAADGTLRLEVRDDGCGFDPRHRRREALGLISMEERALALGGRFEVHSEPGKGTTVRLICPLSRRVPLSAA